MLYAVTLYPYIYACAAYVFGVERQSVGFSDAEKAKDEKKSCVLFTHFQGFSPIKIRRWQCRRAGQPILYSSICTVYWSTQC